MKGKEIDVSTNKLTHLVRFEEVGSLKTATKNFHRIRYFRGKLKRSGKIINPKGFYTVMDLQMSSDSSYSKE